MVIRLLTHGRFLYLALLAALTLWLAIAASGVGVERNNESLKTTDAAEEETYRRFKETFGSDEDLLLAVAHPRLLSAEGLSLIADLTQRLGQIEGVRHVYSLANAQRPVAGELGAEMAPLVTEGATEDTVRAVLDADPWDPLESTCRHASLSIL